ncbi:MAG: arginine--tRNA ligase [Burkholderiales bacterium]
MPQLKNQLTQLVADAAESVAPEVRLPIELNRPKLAQHGDWSCSAALQLAKSLSRNPGEIARILLDAIPAAEFLEKAEIAGAGFINFFLTSEARHEVVREIHEAGQDYGRSELGRGKRVLLEFVSANPTGPLHVGHGRSAAYGASLANVLDAAGYQVAREYYVNDAGRQMDILALSVWLRYLHLIGDPVSFPANCYQGGYVTAMARQIQELHGTRYHRNYDPGAPLADPEAELDRLIVHAKESLGDDYAYIHDFALTEQLGDCRNDLAEFGVHFDCWFSEASLHASGAVARALQKLAKSGNVYEQDGALWFRASRYGDEKDRVVRRENAEYTYFASDIAYHANKFERGFDRVIDIWGADHHGYIGRLRGAISALEYRPEKFAVALVQFAVLYRRGKKVSMSTRSGEFVTLRELRQEVGNDAARFFYVMRKSDQHLDFDLDLAKSQSNDNPVYYVQYAHARICSVLKEWGGDARDLGSADLSPLKLPQEFSVLRALEDYPEAVEAAAKDLSPHVIAFYLKDLAAHFHSYYNATRFLTGDSTIAAARLALVAATGKVLKNGLALLGVSAPETM